jgi:hypothetical protein
VHIAHCVAGTGKLAADSFCKNRRLGVWHGACSGQGRRKPVEQGAVMPDSNPIVAINQSNWKEVHSIQQKVEPTWK